MIERDLKIIRNNVLDTTPDLEWILQYMKEHEEEIKKPMTDEEEKLRKSDEYNELLNNIILNGMQISEVTDPKIQQLAVKQLYNVIDLALQLKSEFSYAEISFIELLNDHQARIIARSKADSLDLNDISYTGYNRNVLGEILDYDPSKHSAVNKMLSDSFADGTETVYEEYYDPDEDKYYYIGYIPVLYNENGKYLQCVKYDWSDFHNKLLKSALSSMLIGLIVLIILNSLLMLLIYYRAISPIQKITRSILKYKNDKISSDVSENMSQIKGRNELCVLADSFSDLTSEIDRHTNEILELNSEKERNKAELSLAASIQSNALPKVFPAFPERHEFDIYASMTPAKEVGGDFYDFFLIDDDHIALIIADVAGKGVPAALFMMTAKSLIKNMAQLGEYSPAKILSDVNEQLFENNEMGLFVTVWLAVIQLSTGKGMAANAGHEHPALKHKDGKYELVKYRHSLAVAAMSGIKFREHEFELNKGDVIFVYTDGVPEATNSNEELFGVERLVDALNSEPDASNEKLLDNVKKAVDNFVGDAPQFDDLTMLSFTYYGKDDE